MLDFIKKLERQIEILEERIQKGEEYTKGVIAGIEKLSQEKANSIRESHVVTGAIEAYQNVASELKKMAGIAEEATKEVASETKEFVHEVAECADRIEQEIGEAIDIASGAVDSMKEFIRK